jgi:hypothetical protein
MLTRNTNNRDGGHLALMSNASCQQSLQGHNAAAAFKRANIESEAPRRLMCATSWRVYAATLRVENFGGNLILPEFLVHCNTVTTFFSIYFPGWFRMPEFIAPQILKSFRKTKKSSAPAR